MPLVIYLLLIGIMLIVNSAYSQLDLSVQLIAESSGFDSQRERERLYFGFEELLVPHRMTGRKVCSFPVAG